MIKLEPTPGTCIGYTGILDKPVKSIDDIQFDVTSIGGGKIVTLVIPGESTIEHSSLVDIPGTKKKLLFLESSTWYNIFRKEFSRRVRNGQKVLAHRKVEGLRIGDRVVYCPWSEYPDSTYSYGGEYSKITSISKDMVITITNIRSPIYTRHCKFVPTDAEVNAELGSLPE